MKAVLEFEMPRHCKDCVCDWENPQHDHFCSALEYERIPDEGKRKDCPLKEAK
jgi:hypothetical protein